MEYEEDILQLKQQATGAARTNLQENIDMMRLQRDIKDKATKLTALQTQYEGLDAVSVNKNPQLLPLNTKGTVIRFILIFLSRLYSRYSLDGGVEFAPWLTGRLCRTSGAN